jgi:hypothetical protein
MANRYRANTAQIFVPPTMPFTARNIYDFYRLRNAGGPNAMNMRQRLGVALGLGPGATSNQIARHHQFRHYFRRYQNLLHEGGLRHTNLQGGTQWPAGHSYTRYSTPVVRARTHHLWTIPRALQVYVPHLSRRAAQILVRLTQPSINETRPGLPAAIARRIASIVRRAEILQVRNNPFSAPVPRHFTNRRALPAPPAPPANNNNNNAPRPRRRSARRAARR